MDYKTITQDYYSKWLGADRILLDTSTGILFIYSEERNKIQYGYDKQFDVYVLKTANKLIISYGDKAADKINALKNALAISLNIDGIINILEKTYEIHVGHNIKYYFTKVIHKSTAARNLTNSDYSAYLAFFKKCNPKCKNTNWVKEYFEKMVSKHLCCGVFDDELLVSCTDTPGMPYMTETVQEIGINTLPEYRCKGFATDSCALCVSEIINNGKCPLWSTNTDNVTSQRLAEKVGFTKLSDVLTLTI